MRSRILYLDMIRILGTIFAGLLGLAFGSFLNVCLSRWPAGESVVKPRSHCRQCGRTLTWWENVPLVSWLALRGRCRTCRAWIGWRYPLVEAAVGALWAFSIWSSLPAIAEARLPSAVIAYLLAGGILHMVLIWLLVSLAMLDAEQFWLPDFLTLPGAAIGLACAVLDPFILLKLDSLTGLPLTEGMEGMRLGLWTPGIARLCGVLAAAGLILLIRWLYWLIRRREGIGLGDAKLMALLAAWLGLPCALLAFGIGVVLGALVAIARLAVPSARRESETWAMSKLPLGTFLCIGGIVSSLWGQPILAAYQRWAGF
jgi:leader peptidase (prepilin peptidase)/N-methyltransferase